MYVGVPKDRCRCFYPLCFLSVGSERSSAVVLLGGWSQQYGRRLRVPRHDIPWVFQKNFLMTFLRVCTRARSVVEMPGCTTAWMHSQRLVLLLTNRECGVPFIYMGPLSLCRYTCRYVVTGHPELNVSACMAAYLPAMLIV